MRIAQIINNKVYNIMELNNVPDNDGSIIYRKVSNNIHKGFTYDTITDSFVDNILIEGIISKVKELGQVTKQKILSQLSDTDQRNSLYKLYRHGKKSKSSLTVSEKAEISDLESKWDTIESIREASNAIEVEINSLQIIEEIQVYDTVTNPLWP